MSYCALLKQSLFHYVRIKILLYNACAMGGGGVVRKLHTCIRHSELEPNTIPTLVTLKSHLSHT